MDSHRAQHQHPGDAVGGEAGLLGGLHSGHHLADGKDSAKTLAKIISGSNVAEDTKDVLANSKNLADSLHKLRVRTKRMREDALACDSPPKKARTDD